MEGFFVNLQKRWQMKKLKKKLKRILAFVAAVIAVLFYIADELDISYGQEGSSNAWIPESIHQLEIPQMTGSVNSQRVEYLGFSLSYNSLTRLPNWVAWELTSEEAQGELPRKDRFRQDPQIMGPQGDKGDYKHSGWDRGHMAPAGDFKWNGEAMDETYYFTNICPQNTQLNTGDWKELEEQCRRWAVEYGKIYIVCGPIIEDNRHGKLGENEIVIPDKFYKIVLAQGNGGYHAAGFLFVNPPQRKSKISGKPPVKRPLESYLATIDEIEGITGIDFFPSLPDETENALESRKQMIP